MDEIKGIRILSLTGEKEYGIEDSEAREELANVVDGAPEELDSFKEAFEKFKEGGEALAGIAAEVAAVGKAVTDEKTRAENAEKDIKRKAVDVETLNASALQDKVDVYFRNLNGVQNGFTIPAATTEKAGVMTAQDKKKLDNLAEVGDSYDLNTYMNSGVYLINTGSNDAKNYPIQTPANSVLRLTVIDSYDGNNHVITQVLNINNHVGGEGNIYIRSCQNGEWKAWGKLQTNVEVGLIDQAKMDDLIDNGVYSGILSTTGETFVIICINNYAIAQQVGVQHISHLKYSLVVGTGEVKIEKRTRDAYGFWTEWENIGSGSTLPEATVDTVGGVKLGKINNNKHLPLVNIDIDGNGNEGSGVGIKIDSKYFMNSSDGLTFNHDSTLILSQSTVGVNLGTATYYQDVIPCVLGSDITDSIKYGLNNLAVGIPYNSKQFYLNVNGLNLVDGISSGTTKVTWEANSNMNDFKTPGVYDIYGERTRQDDNLPILNASSGHSIAARLTVVASTLQPANNEICITQFLQLSNRVGGEGATYVRTYNENNNGMNGWSPWQKQMGMVETLINSNDTTVGQEVFSSATQKIGDGLNGMIDNGMYSGIYIDKIAYNISMNRCYLTGEPTFVETFVLIVINDYAASGNLNLPRHITQLKYAVDAITGQSTVKKRVGTGNDSISWSDWEDIGGGGSQEVDITDDVIAYGLPTLIAQGYVKEGTTYKVACEATTLPKFDNNNKITTHINSIEQGLDDYIIFLIKCYKKYENISVIIDCVVIGDTITSYFKYNINSINTQNESVKVSEDMTIL